jgi:hypothetical protein
MKTITFRFGRQVHEIAEALQGGAVVWGGGVSVRPSGEGTIYAVSFLNENGKEGRTYVDDAHEAAWDWVRRTGGEATAAIESPHDVHQYGDPTEGRRGGGFDLPPNTKET